MKAHERKPLTPISESRHALLIVLLSLSGQGAAQQEPDATRSPAEAPEEIVVTGERSTMQLRLQMFEAEELAYEMFNQFNDERRFDISCSIQERTGSRFERQICQPEFEIQAERAHAQDYLDTMPRDGGLPPGSLAPTRPPMEVEIKRQQEAFKRRMQQVAEEHPEFLDAIARYAELQQQYRERTGQTSP